MDSLVNVPQYATLSVYRLEQINEGAIKKRIYQEMPVSYGVRTNFCLYVFILRM